MYAKASTMPMHVAVALRPPKSVAAVPDMSEVRPMDVMKIKTDDHPTVSGEEKRNIAITIDSTKVRPQSHAAGGPRRDWKILSEMMPPLKPPTIPKTHVYHPQCWPKNSAPTCGTLLQKLEYQFKIL